jgi:drug/metabolite transporter (DMT)-like permease
MDVLPLQYGISLVPCIPFVPFELLAAQQGIGPLLPLAYMGIVISVFATVLLYQLIQRGNLVNVTSLFYLVPVVTAALDYVFFGNTLGAASLAGMAAIILGLMLVFHNPHS